MAKGTFPYKAKQPNKQHGTITGGVGQHPYQPKRENKNPGKITGKGGFPYKRTAK